MKALTRLGPLFLCMIAVSLLLVSPAQAAVSCHTIHAKGAGREVPDGDGNPLTVATVADIKGGGLLHGVTAANFGITEIVGTVASFTGTLVFTTNKATLTVDLEGTLNLATGEFQAAGPVTGATGKLAGATGTLVFAGVQDLAAGTFVEKVTGNICVDLAP